METREMSQQEIIAVIRELKAAHGQGDDLYECYKKQEEQKAAFYMAQAWGGW